MYDDASDLEWLIQYVPPIPREDLDQIQTVLEAEDPFIPGIFLNNPYDVVSYLPRQMIWREELCLLVDRNLVTRWIGMIGGHEATPQHRIAAAVMAFAQAADLLIEPNIAFYEMSSTFDPGHVNREIRDFYRAEHTHPMAWAAIALGRSDRMMMTEAILEREHSAFDLSRPLYIWRRNYVLALKIAEIHLQGGRPEDQMVRLLRWMYDDFLIGGPAILLASFYFAPGAPRRNLLKHIQSADRDRAIAGIRNSTWDLTLISEWLRLVKAQGPEGDGRRLYLLCTLDRAVKQMARSMISFEESETNYDLQLRALSQVWGANAAARLAAILDQYQSTATDPARHVHSDPGAEIVDLMIRQGEAVVRQWKSSS